MVWMCPNKKCSYIGELKKNEVCPQCGTKAGEYTSWLGEVSFLKRRKANYQESLKQKPAEEKRTEEISKDEGEIYRREQEITKREHEVSDGESRLQHEVLRKAEEITKREEVLKRREQEIVKKEREVSGREDELSRLEHEPKKGNSNESKRSLEIHIRWRDCLKFWASAIIISLLPLAIIFFIFILPYIRPLFPYL